MGREEEKSQDCWTQQVNARTVFRSHMQAGVCSSFRVLQPQCTRTPSSMSAGFTRASYMYFQRSLLLTIPYPSFICHSRAGNIPAAQLSFWASPAMLSKGQIQCSCTHSLLAWRSAKLRLSGSTHCFMRPLRCMSKQRLERNRCLSSMIRLETLTGSCLGLLALPR